MSPGVGQGGSGPGGMRFGVTLQTGGGFNIWLLWEVIPQAIGLLGGSVVPLDNKGPPTIFFLPAIAAKPLRNNPEVAY